MMVGTSVVIRSQVVKPLLLAASVHQFLGQKEALPLLSFVRSGKHRALDLEPHPKPSIFCIRGHSLLIHSSHSLLQLCSPALGAMGGARRQHKVSALGCWLSLQAETCAS